MNKNYYEIGKLYKLCRNFPEDSWKRVPGTHRVLPKKKLLLLKDIAVNEHNDKMKYYTFYCLEEKKDYKIPLNDAALSLIFHESELSIRRVDK